MFRKILVPLDGSERAERALPIAARLARASGGSIILLRVIHSPLRLVDQAIEEPLRGQDALDTDQVRAIHYVERIAASDMLVGTTTAAEAFRGMPAEIILSVARSQGVDIIILCSHGYSGVTRWMMGSVAQQVAFHASIPVLVLREGGSVLAGLHQDAAQPLRALVALDGSSRAEGAIEPAASLIAALSSPTQGSLHLTQIVPPVAASRDEWGLSEDILHTPRGYLSAIRDDLRDGRLAPVVAERKLGVTCSVEIDIDVASALIRVAEHGENAQVSAAFAGCDMIAMATHGFNGVQRWGVGSITERVLKATRLPLLIIRPLDIMEKSHLLWNEANLSGI